MSDTGPLLPDDPAPTRRRPVDAEHIIQKHAKMFARDAIDAPHRFFAFDRSKAAGRFTHMREKARGVTKATPDTVTLVGGVTDAWCEFKRPGKRPDDDQKQMLADLRSLGRHASWADCVTAYAEFLHECGVPLRANWRLIAADHDARVQGEIERAQMKAGKVPSGRKPVTAKPTIGQVRRVQRNGFWSPRP